MYDFPLKILSVKYASEEALTYGLGDRQVQLDDLDRKILKRLSAGGETSYRQIAQELGVVSTKLLYRVERLKDQGVILGARYLVDPPKIGMQAFISLIYVKEMNAKLRASFNGFCRKHPHVYCFQHCLGNWDLEAGTIVSTAEELISFTQDLTEALGGKLVKVKTLPLFFNHKVSNFPL